MKRVVLVLVASLLTCDAFAAPEPRPKVLVKFVVTAPEFIADLGDQKAACEREVAGAAAQQLGTDFPFLEWVTDAAADHQLTLTLNEQAGAGDVDTFVEYRGSDSNDPPPTHLIYSWLDPRDRDDPRPVISGLRDKVKKDIKSSSGELKGYFTSKVPIAKRVEIEGERVIVPVSGVHADSTSLINVRFVALNQPGAMQLQDAMEYAPRGIFCAVSSFSGAGITRNAWSNDIARILTDHASDIRVLMIDYRADAYPGARNGAVTTPQ